MSDEDSDDGGAAVREMMGFASFGSQKPAPKPKKFNPNNPNPKFSTGANSAPISKRPRFSSGPLDPTSTSFTPSYLSTTALIPASLSTNRTAPKSIPSSMPPKHELTTPPASPTLSAQSHSPDLNTSTSNLMKSVSHQLNAMDYTQPETDPVLERDNWQSEITSSFDYQNLKASQQSFQENPYLTAPGQTPSPNQPSLHNLPPPLLATVLTPYQAGNPSIPSRYPTASGQGQGVGPGYTHPISKVHIPQSELDAFAQGRRTNADGVPVFFKPSFVNEDPWAEVLEFRKRKGEGGSRRGWKGNGRGADRNEAEGVQNRNQRERGFEFGGHDVRRDELAKGQSPGPG